MLEVDKMYSLIPTEIINNQYGINIEICEVCKSNEMGIYSIMLECGKYIYSRLFCDLEKSQFEQIVENMYSKMLAMIQGKINIVL